MTRELIENRGALKTHVIELERSIINKVRLPEDVRFLTMWPNDGRGFSLCYAAKEYRERDRNLIVVHAGDPLPCGLLAFVCGNRGWLVWELIQAW